MVGKLSRAASGKTKRWKEHGDEINDQQNGDDSGAERTGGPLYLLACANELPLGMGD
jgi:hypothetical protein